MTDSNAAISVTRQVVELVVGAMPRALAGWRSLHIRLRQTPVYSADLVVPREQFSWARQFADRLVVRKAALRRDLATAGDVEVITRGLCQAVPVITGRHGPVPRGLGLSRRSDSRSNLGEFDLYDAVCRTGWTFANKLFEPECLDRTTAKQLLRRAGDRGSE